MTYFDLPNDIFRCPAKRHILKPDEIDFFCRQPTEYILGCLILKKLIILLILFIHYHDVSWCTTHWYFCSTLLIIIFVYVLHEEYTSQLLFSHNFLSLSSQLPAQNNVIWWSLYVVVHTHTNDIFQHLTKWPISTPEQVTYFDARTNDIFRCPTKWHILMPNQMTYFDARPNDIFRDPTRWHF